MDDLFEVSDHAHGRLNERLIPRSALDSVLRTPQQVVSEQGGRKAYQSIVHLAGRTFLIRAIIDDSTDPPVVVTVYRTTRISKYWRPS